MIINTTGHDPFIGARLPEWLKRASRGQINTLRTSLNAHHAVFDPAGNRDGSTPVHQFAQPVAVLDTPSSLSLASDGPVAQYAGEHLSQVAQGDVQISAAHTREHLDRAIDAFTRIGRELGVI